MEDVPRNRDDHCPTGVCKDCIIISLSTQKKEVGEKMSKTSLKRFSRFTKGTLVPKEFAGLGGNDI